MRRCVKPARFRRADEAGPVDPVVLVGIRRGRVVRAVPVVLVPTRRVQVDRAVQVDIPKGPVPIHRLHPDAEPLRAVSVLGFEWSGTSPS